MTLNYISKIQESPAKDSYDRIVLDSIRYGGKKKVEDKEIVMINTCAVDTGLTVLFSIINDYNHILKFIHENKNESETLSAVSTSFDFWKKKKWTDSKISFLILDKQIKTKVEMPN